MNGPDSSQFAPLIGTPGAHYCPDCFGFVTDCSHAVDPIDMPRVHVDDSIIVAVGYDRVRRILELEDNVGAVYRYAHVARSTAVGIARKPGSAGELLRGKRFRRVRRRS